MSLGSNAASLATKVSGMVATANAAKAAPAEPRKDTPVRSTLAHVARGEEPSPAPRARAARAVAAAVPAPESEAAPEPAAAAPESTETGTEPAAESEPQSIDPPGYWSDEQKAHWEALPDEVKKTIAGRETERETLLKTRDTETAAEKQARIKAEDGARQFVNEQVTALRALFGELSQTFQGQQEPDWNRVLQEEGSEAYLAKKQQFEERKKAWDALTQKVNGVVAGNQAKAKEAYDAWVAEQHQKLVKADPEWGDPAKREAKWNAHVEALTAYGYSPQEIAGFQDARHYSVLGDALKWRNHLKNLPKTAAALKAAKPMAKPGARAGNASATERRIQDATNRHRQTGNVRTLAGVVRALGGQKG